MYVVLLAESATSSQLAVRIAEEAKRKHYKSTGEELKQYVLPDSERSSSFILTLSPVYCHSRSDSTAHPTRNSRRRQTSKSTSLASPSTSCCQRTRRRRQRSNPDHQSCSTRPRSQPLKLVALQRSSRRAKSRAGSLPRSRRRRRVAGDSSRDEPAYCRGRKSSNGLLVAFFCSLLNRVVLHILD